jgi:hypothetical protein
MLVVGGMNAKMGKIGEIWACVCRGVLRFWGTRIQDSRTDFRPKTQKFIDSTSTRGWCKIKTPDGIVGGIRIDRVLNVETETQDRVDGIEVGVYECLL